MRVSLSIASYLRCYSLQQIFLTVVDVVDMTGEDGGGGRPTVVERGDSINQRDWREPPPFGNFPAKPFLGKVRFKVRSDRDL